MNLSYVLTQKIKAIEKIDDPLVFNYSEKVLLDFLAAFAAFFSFAVKSGFFLVSFLLSCPLLMILSS